MGDPRFHLNITRRCNLRCEHCYLGRPLSGDPDLEVVQELLQMLAAFARSEGAEGPYALTLGGGEPTLRDDLEAIVASASSYGFKVRMVSNGIGLTADRCHALVRAGLSTVQISLDGSCRQTHDAIRGNGAWDAALAGISALKAARIPVILSMILLPGKNIEEASALLDMSQELDVAGCKFARPLLAGNALDNDLDMGGDGVYLKTFRQILARARALQYRRFLLFFDPLAHQLGVSASQARPRLPGLRTDLCRCGATELVEVDGVSGEVFYCRVRQPLGNIFQEDLSTIWQHHPLLSGLRRREPEGACGQCEVWSSCRGGCPAVMRERLSEHRRADVDCEAVAQGSPGQILEESGFAYSDPKPTLGESIRALGRAVDERWRLRRFS